MDDLYNPISDMPGDSGQSSSASGMIKNPQRNSRYAKSNDIIQKYIKPSFVKSNAKYGSLKKMKLNPKWFDEIFESRYVPDTGGARALGSGESGSRIRTTGGVSAATGLSRDATEAARQAEAIARAERILGSADPYSGFGSTSLEVGNITMTPSELANVRRNSFNAGVREVLPAIDARVNAARTAGLAEGERTGAARSTTSQARDKKKNILAQPIGDMLVDMIPLGKEVKTLWNQVGALTKPTRIGRVASYPEGKINPLTGNPYNKLESVRYKYLDDLATNRYMNIGDLEAKYLDYIDAYPDPTIPEANIANFDASHQAAPRKSGWGRKKTLGQDFESIRQKEEQVLQYDDAIANSDKAWSQIGPNLLNMGIKTGIGAGLGTLGYYGGKYYFGNNSSPSDNIKPIETAIPEFTKTPTSENMIPTATPSDYSDFLPPPTREPQGYKRKTFKRMEKGASFHKGPGKVPDPRPIAEIIEELMKLSGIKAVDDPRFIGLYTSAAMKTPGVQAKLRQLGLPSDITYNELTRKYGGWTEDDLKAMKATGVLPAKAKASSGSGSSGGKSSGRKKSTIPAGSVPAVGANLWNVPKSPGEYAAEGLVNAAKWTGGKIVDAAKWSKANPKVSIPLGATLAGTVGGLGYFQPWNQKNEPAAGDVGLPTTVSKPTMLPTMTPTKTSSNPDVDEIYLTPSSSRKYFQSMKQWKIDAEKQKRADEKERQKAEEKRIQEFLKDAQKQVDRAELEYIWDMNLHANKSRRDAPPSRANQPFGVQAYVPHNIEEENAAMKDAMNRWFRPLVLDPKAVNYQPSFGKPTSGNSISTRTPTLTSTPTSTKTTKRAKTINKAKSVPFQGSSNAQTAYVNPVTKNRFDLMTPEERGAAIVNSVAENAKQSYRNTSDYLSDLVRMASGALNAADKQTKFSEKVWPALRQDTREFLDQAYDVTNNIIIPKSKQGYAYTKDVIIPKVQKEAAPAYAVGKQYVVNSVKEFAKNNPDIAGNISTKKIEAGLNNLSQSMPEISRQVTEIGQNLLNSANRGIRRGIELIRPMKKRQSKMNFSKRLEHPKPSNGMQKSNKYFN